MGSRPSRISAVPIYDAKTNSVEETDDETTQTICKRRPIELDTLSLALRDEGLGFFRLGGEIKEADDAFNAAFCDWVCSRDDCIARLANTADHLDRQRLRVNVTSVSASSVGLVGGGVGLAGLFLLPPAAVAGLVVAGVGGAANLATTLAEFGLNKRQQRRVQHMLDADARLSLALDACARALIDKWQELAEASELALRSLHASEAGATSVALLNRDRLSALLGAKAKLVFGVGAGRVLLEDAAESAALAGRLGARALGAAACALSLAVDTLNIVLTSVDLRRGSASAFGLRLRQLADEMRGQLGEMDDTRRALNQQRAKMGRLLLQLDDELQLPGTG